jgi:exosortase A-associated hydrolase 1
MSRRFASLSCEGNQLAATLDTAGATTGLLIVSGGNEVRSGPWASQARIAEGIAAAGFPVFRFDRRGVGDSEGPNAGFESSGPDIAAALQAFRAHVPTLRRVVAYGNCDAASALMLSGGSGCSAMVLANPWTFDPEPVPASADEKPEAAPAAMPPAALRAHYLRRLTDPRALWRLLTGKVELGKLATSLGEAARPASAQSDLAARMTGSLAEFAGPVTILLADRDRTADVFRANWDASDARVRTCPDASHSFVEPQARIWLQGQILAALRAADSNVR